jgi:ATP-dependent Clp protease ATP-binding subunit ClpA
MLRGIKMRLANMGMIKTLCENAERHALIDQQHEPGAEHFLLAALDLHDGTARLAFEEAGANAAAFRDAISSQFSQALTSIGLTSQAAPSDAPFQEPLRPRLGLYNATASGKEVLQTLAAKRRDHHPLLGAHVVAAVAALEHGIAARALRAMGVDREVLRAAAERIARNFKTSEVRPPHLS